MKWTVWKWGDDGVSYTELLAGEYTAIIFGAIVPNAENGYRNRRWEVKYKGIEIASGYTLGSSNSYDLCEMVLKQNGVELPW